MIERERDGGEREGDEEQAYKARRDSERMERETEGKCSKERDADRSVKDSKRAERDRE